MNGPFDDLAYKNSLVEANVRKAMREAQAKPFDISTPALMRKGDVPGHEFHGNQYASGEGGGDNKATMPSARQMAAESKARNEAARGSKEQQAKDKAADVKAREKFSGETKAAHEALTAHGYTRTPEKDIKGREGMRAYTNARGDTVLQSSGLAIHTTSGGKKTVMNSSKELKAHLSRSKKAVGLFESELSKDDISTPALMRKGDLPGHEFHGNQWTEGSTVERVALSRHGQGTIGERKVIVQKPYNGKMRVRGEPSNVRTGMGYEYSEHETPVHEWKLVDKK